jgi:hypothetical protein
MILINLSHENNNEISGESETHPWKKFFNAGRTNLDLCSNAGEERGKY